MPARRVKTLLKNPLMRNHREHRSKKGRKKPREKWGRILDWKKRKEELKIIDLHEDIS